MRLRERKQANPQIPTASMGDIAFLIIIFFMTTSIFSREKGLKIVLPEKGQEVKIKSENILTIAVNPQGEVLIRDQIVDIPSVKGIVEEELRKNPDLVIALKVYRTAKYQTMIRVFDQIKLAKAEKISLVPVKEGS
ncbi:MAG: biopolymer transporter ExbD [candidate division WOR-3 bacterium]|nr:biopolymer transporter ExbD [candidate division WOR-3 bacterium]MDW7987090.1 biopolymer transporter ExbD [candidate division WOR-3 bacterium]